MRTIIEARDLPEGDKVYLKKDWLGWRTVEPYRTPEGKWQPFNLLLGGKRNMLFLVFVMILMFVAYTGVQELIGNYRTIAESPCDFCDSCFEQTRRVLDQSGRQDVKINFSFEGVV